MAIHILVCYGLAVFLIFKNMFKMKLYFIKDDLFAKTKEQVIQYMIENALVELTVYKSKE